MAKRKTHWAMTDDKLPIRLVNRRAWWPADAPIHWPTNEDGTPAYKVTVCPAPDRALKSNTHGEHG